MGARSERLKNKRIKLVGGGFRWTRGDVNQKSGGSLKSMRRTLRHALKDKKLTPESRRSIKARLAELLAQKDGR